MSALPGVLSPSKAFFVALESKYMAMTDHSAPVDAGAIAVHLKTTRPTVLRWARDGSIPCLRPAKNSRKVLFVLSDVLAALERNGQPMAQVAPEGPVQPSG
ncbi:MAG TPA: helix-turn-helix domain-containing protein [Gemmataceae bacterium]|nr:helix-turn-helix domain-containing protein [Gemmataceae bacterium]